MCSIALLDRPARSNCRRATTPCCGPAIAAATPSGVDFPAIAGSIDSTRPGSPGSRHRTTPNRNETAPRHHHPYPAAVDVRSAQHNAPRRHDMAGEPAFFELGVEDDEKGRAFYSNLFG